MLTLDIALSSVFQFHLRVSTPFACWTLFFASWMKYGRGDDARSFFFFRMADNLRVYTRRDYVRRAYQTNLKWGREIKKLRKIVTRVMESHKENAGSDLYLDMLSLRTFKVDPMIMLYDELKRDRFWNVEEMDRFKDGYIAAREEYLKLFQEYSHY